MDPLALDDAIRRLKIPHQDDRRRQPRMATRHARSIDFLLDCGLVPDAKTRRYLDRAAIAGGMAIALPDVSEALFQLALDWTNHNCLHDDAVESSSHDVYWVAQLSGHYADALRGKIWGRHHHPLVRAMIRWRRRALDLGVEPQCLQRFVDRAERMGSQFVLERLLDRHGAALDEAEYLRQRSQDGPFDAWFELLSMVRGSSQRPDSPAAERLQRLAIQMTVLGNELRTCARERQQLCANNAILRARHPSAAIEHLLELHNATADNFVDEQRTLTDPREQDHARALARAVFATHWYELHSVRGCTWSAVDEPTVGCGTAIAGRAAGQRPASRPSVRAPSGASSRHH